MPPKNRADVGMQHPLKEPDGSGGAQPDLERPRVRDPLPLSPPGGDFPYSTDHSEVRPPHS